MPLRFIRDDIAKVKVDAIVLPANKLLEQGDGASRSIYMAAGEQQLENELRMKYPDGCETGKAVITFGYQLPAKWIIHAVCPQWLDGEHGEAGFLYSAYKESLLLARQNKCRSIAFPLLSTGSYQYPWYEAVKIAVEAILDFLIESSMEVYLVFFSEAAVRKGTQLFGEIKAFVDDAYTNSVDNRYSSPKLRGRFNEDDWYGIREDYQNKLKTPDPKTESYLITDLKGESFREMLLRLISESNKTDPEIYNAANLSRQTFNKIKQQPNYMPKKKTILAIAVALELSSYEANVLLMKAGCALTDCDDFDLIMQYCFDNRTLDFKEINELLEAYGLEDQCFPVKDEEEQ